jgi:hypothetical protein
MRGPSRGICFGTGMRRNPFRHGLLEPAVSWKPDYGATIRLKHSA